MGTITRLWTKYKPGATVRAAIVTAVLTGLLTTFGPWALNHFTKEKQLQVGTFSAGIGQVELPRLAILSKEQLVRMQSFDHCLIIHLQNDTGVPIELVNIVAGTEGIAEIIYPDKDSIAMDFNKRLGLTPLHPVSKTTVRIWFKGSLPDDEKVVVLVIVIREVRKQWKSGARKGDAARS
ncbi:MAG TPA: hypothetical protein VE988_13790 [Gemmataceae bacterium]|nr:hypothetical protein [Gemmataceae bacterium]